MTEPLKLSDEFLRGCLELIKNPYDGQIRSLSECLAEVGTPEGRKRVEAYLNSEPFPYFKAHPSKKHFYERTEEDGSRSFGHFVDREWVREP